MSDFVRPLERPEWNFFAEACKPLQFILGALGHTEITVAVRSSDLLECYAARVVNVTFRVPRQVLRIERSIARGEFVASACVKINGLHHEEILRSIRGAS